MSIEKITAAKWLQIAATEKTISEPQTVIVPQKPLCFRDCTLKPGQLYVIPETIYKKLLQSFQEPPLVKDFNLTNFINFLIEKNWEPLSKTEIMDKDYLIAVDGDYGLFKNPVLTDQGHVSEKESLQQAASNTGTQTDFYTRREIKIVLEHSLIKNLCDKLREYNEDKENEPIEFTELFNTVAPQRNTWETAKDFLTPKNAVFGALFGLFITVSFGIANQMELRNEEQPVNFIDGFLIIFSIVLAGKLQQPASYIISPAVSVGHKVQEKIAQLSQRFFPTLPDDKVEIDFNLLTKEAEQLVSELMV